MTLTEKKAALVRCLESLANGSTDPVIKAAKGLHLQRQARAIFAECGEVYGVNGWTKA